VTAFHATYFQKNSGKIVFLYLVSERKNCNTCIFTNVLSGGRPHVVIDPGSIVNELKKPCFDSFLMAMQGDGLAVEDIGFMGVWDGPIFPEEATSHSSKALKKCQSLMWNIFSLVTLTSMVVLLKVERECGAQFSSRRVHNLIK